MGNYKKCAIEIANLAKILPTGPTLLAYQREAAESVNSFTIRCDFGLLS
jgi:hypothetical protein